MSTQNESYARNDEPRRVKWRHRQADKYLPVFGDFFGDEQRGFHKHWSRVDTPKPSILAAKRAGFDVMGSDDFNIAVIRNGRVVALLWMAEDMAEEQDVLDQITGELL